MIIEKEDLFSTRILLVDNVLEEKYINSIKEDILSSSKKTPRNNWQSGPELHNEESYKQLVKKVYTITQSYFEDMSWNVEDYKITSMWSNILKPGERHSMHTHSNNVLSGVYYVQTTTQSIIQFYDPRPQTRILIPEIKEDNKYNSTAWFYPSVVNRLLMFPSWLEHDVPINNTQEDRISISWNVMFKGQVGVPKYFQSSEF